MGMLLCKKIMSEKILAKAGGVQEAKEIFKEMVKKG